MVHMTINHILNDLFSLQTRESDLSFYYGQAADSELLKIAIWGRTLPFLLSWSRKIDNVVGLHIHILKQDTEGQQNACETISLEKFSQKCPLETLDQQWFHKENWQGCGTSVLERVPIYVLWSLYGPFWLFESYLTFRVLFFSVLALFTWSQRM